MTSPALAALLIACGGGGTEPPSPDEELPPPPALESVAYERLGAGKLAFRRLSDGNYLYVIDATARTVSALTMYPLSADPALSPDGTRVAYIAWSGSGQNSSAYDVSTKNLAGADSQRVSALAGQESSPSWSSDGRSVYFLSVALGGIYRQPVSSAPLAPTPVLVSNADPCFILPQSPVSASVSGRIAFSCVNAIHTATADGTDRREIISRTTPAGRVDAFYAPTWSPNAEWLAFAHITSEAPTSPSSPVLLSIRIMRADGSDVRTVVSMTMAPVVSTLGHNDLSLAWSPDGARLAFNVSEGPLASHIHVVGVDGTGLVQLTTRPGVHDHSLTWVK